MSKKKPLLAAAFSGRKRGSAMTLNSTWGSGRDNALTSGWGGKSKRGGGGFIPRAWGGKSKRVSLLTPATWEKRRGRKQNKMAKAFGVSGTRKRQNGRGLDAVWGKRTKAGRGTLLSILGARKRRGKGQSLVAAIFNRKRGRRRTAYGNVARAIARAAVSAQGHREQIADEIMVREIRARQAAESLTNNPTIDTSIERIEQIDEIGTAVVEDWNPIAALFSRLRGQAAPGVTAARERRVQEAIQSLDDPQMRITYAQAARLQTTEARDNSAPPVVRFFDRVRLEIDRLRRR